MPRSRFVRSPGGGDSTVRPRPVIGWVQDCRMLDLLPMFAGDDETSILDSSITNEDWLRAGAIVLGAIVVAVIAGRATRRVVGRLAGSGLATLITARLVSYVTIIIGAFYALNSLGVRVGPLLGALGLGGLVLALALQDVVGNFVGAITLQTRRPFTVGDTVRLAEHTGTVIDIDARTTVLRGLDGTIIRIPNSIAVSDAIVNLTRDPTRRSSLAVSVAYDTDLDAATSAIGEAVRHTVRVLPDPAPVVLLTEFGGSAIDFTVQYWHASDVPSELLARHDLMRSIHHTLADANITIAFPQVVVWSGEPRAEPIYSERPTEIHSAPAVAELIAATTRVPRSWRRRTPKDT